MTDWLNAELFTSLLIFYLINALPSSMFGIAMARRAGRPGWHGWLPGFLLPWFGLLFLTGAQPTGRAYRTGPARYSMVMLAVAGLMVFISIWLPWVRSDGELVGQSGQVEYSPNEVLVVAILVWLLALTLLLSAVGLLYGGAFSVAVTIGVIVSLIGGVLAVVWYLFGPAGMFLSEARFDGARGEVDAAVLSGALVALVALVSAYVSVLVLPFGLHVRPVQPVLTQPAPEQQWMGQPPQVPQAPQQPTRRPGATW